MPKTGVLIVNTGSPKSPLPSDVGSYLSEFLSDPRIRPMDSFIWDVILNRIIVPKRSKVSGSRYERIWMEEGSPLSVNMKSLASKLQNELESDDFVVHHAMSYGEPSIYDALIDFRNEGCDQITAIALYPQSAYSTSYVVNDKIHNVLKDMNWNPGLRFIRNYSDDPLYHKAIANSIIEAGFNPDKDELLMAFHSIPMKDIEAGDTYAKQVESSTNNIVQQLNVPKGSWYVGFQCRFDKSRKWLGPFTSEILQNMDKNKRLFVVAPNFSIDCLETLYEIEIELKESYLESNPKIEDGSFKYVPCLNDSDAQVELLKSLICD